MADGERAAVASETGRAGATSAAGAAGRLAPRIAPRLALLGRHADTAAVAAAVGWWATALVRGSGGREPHLLSVACVLLAVAVLVVRPWRTLPLWVWLLGTGLGLAALLVVLTAPTGLAGAHEAASYTYAGLLGPTVWSWASTAQRRTALLGALVASGGLQFAQGWLAWWGHQDVAEPFQGTFYWHNQAGIFLTAGALLAFAVVAAPRGPLTALGWAIGPLCATGVVLSTSRGSQLGLALGTGLLLVATAATRGRRLGSLRLVGVVALSWMVTNLLAGPLVVQQAGGGAEPLSPTAGTAARAGSFVSNGIQRFEDWRRAVEIFVEWPVTGAGFYSFDAATSAVTSRRDGVVTAFAHNGFLQALADGGLVLALPLLTAVALVLLRGVRRLPAALRAGDPTTVGALVTFLVLVLHSGMDFDWTYPALLALASLVGALAAGPRSSVPADPAADTAVGPAAGTAADPDPRPEPGGPPVSRGLGTLLALVPVALLLAAAVGAWPGGLNLNAPL